MNKLEEEFLEELKLNINNHKDEIDNLVLVAHQLLNKAEVLSEKYNIPFASSISPLAQIYAPIAFCRELRKVAKTTNKFDESELVRTIEELIGGYTNNSDFYTGWQTSALC